MSRIVITALVLLASACASGPKPELRHSPDLTTAMLIYTPNYGEIRLRRVDLSEQQVLDGGEVLPAISDDDIHLIRFSSNPLLQDESSKKAQADLSWNVPPDSEIVFAQKRLVPGDYAMVSYKERSITYCYNAYGTMCFREEAPVLRVAAGAIYYMDSINTMTERSNSSHEVAVTSAELLQVLLLQKPMIQGDVEPLDVVEIISFDPPSGIFQKGCAIGQTFSEAAD